MVSRNTPCFFSVSLCFSCHFLLSLLSFTVLSSVVRGDGIKVFSEKNTKIANEMTTIPLICNFKLPPGDSVEKIIWQHNKEDVYTYRKGEPVKITDTNYEGRIQTYGHGETAASIELRNLRESDGGTWTCTIVTTEYNVGNSDIELSIRVMPRIRGIYRIPEDDMDVNDSVSIICQVDSNGKDYPSISFYQNGQVRQKSQDNFINIDRVSRKDVGEWFCVAENSVGRDQSSKIQIPIRYKPYLSRFENGVKQYNASLGSNFQLKCSFQSYPHLTSTQWYKQIEMEYQEREREKEEEPKLSTPAIWTKILPETVVGHYKIELQPSSSVLHIKSVESTDLGTYKCVVFNQVGSSNCDVVLTEGEDSSTQTRNYLKENSSPMKTKTTVLILISWFVFSLLFH